MDLLQMSVSGGAFILAVVVIRAVAINRLPKKTFLILWELVLARLLIPFSIPSAYSVQTLAQRVLPVASPETEQGNAVVDFLTRERETTVRAIKQIPANNTASSVSVSVWLIAWCAGTLFLFLFFVIVYLRCLAKFRTALPVRNEFIETWLAWHPCKRPISIRQTDRITVPLTYGVFRPVILLPKTMNWENTAQLQYVLTHEYVHISRYDTVTKLVVAAVLCVHWFNPFVWVMHVLFNRDIELVCDESVIRRFGEQSKSAYALMLIGMEEQKSGWMPLGNSFSKNATEERITAIMKTKK